MKLATLWARIGGALIDLIFILLISGVVCFVWGFFIGLSGSEMNLSTYESDALWKGRGMLVGLSVDCIYTVLLMTSSAQSTYGQRAVGIKIIKDNGTEIGFGTATGRWFASLFSSVILKIGYLIAIFTTDKKTLHDLIAGTIVVEKDEKNEADEKNEEINFQKSQIKNEKIEVIKAKNFESMEDAYVKASEIKLQPQQTIKNTNHLTAGKLESMEDAYSQIAQEKLHDKKNIETQEAPSKKISEEKIWELVAEEFDGANRKKGLYAKLFAEKNGDELQIKVAYYKTRVEEIRNNN